MTLPQPLSECINGARHFIRDAHSFNVTAAAGNAEQMLRTAKAYVRPEPALNAAFTDAIGCIADFHEEVVDQNTLTAKVTSVIENARQIALLSIDRLADALVDAKPSEEAAAIGLDWF
jgi:tagatose-1,6-bisphosphate aldolase non-catalytic subunit AgaZ/GatZ